MDTTGLLVSTASVAAASPVAAAVVRGYRAFGGARLVRCPETAMEAIVKIKVTRAIASQLAGGVKLPLKSCSRWPANKSCAQSCAAQIAGSSNGCRRPALPSLPRASQTPTSASDSFIGLS